MISVKGGYSGKVESPTTKEFVGLDGKPAVFVHIARREHWIERMVGTVTAGLKRCANVCNDLRVAYEAKLSSLETHSAPAEVANDDPMFELDDPDGNDAVTPKRARTTGKRRTNARDFRNQVLTVEMPARSKTAAPDEAHIKRGVTLAIISRGQGQGPGAIYLHNKDLPWLITYMGRRT